MCRRDFTPSTKLGRFDVCYDPAGQDLKVTLRVTFDLTGLPGRTSASEAQARRFVLERAGQFWSGRHRLVLPAGGAERIVTVQVRLVEVKERPHFPVFLVAPEVQSHVVAGGLTLVAPGQVFEARHERCVIGLGWPDPTDELHAVVHETGHMLGLDDEYPNGRGTIRHARLFERYLGPGILWARGLDDRVMSTGLSVAPEHGVVFAEALTRLTGRNHIRVLRTRPPPVSGAPLRF